MIDREFEGRRVVVTGAGSGMGLAAARLLVERGATVLGVARSDAALAAIRAVGATAFRADVTDGADRAPDEAAEVILFLLSPRSSYLTAQVINVAGGFVTW